MIQNTEHWYENLTHQPPPRNSANQPPRNSGKHQKTHQNQNRVSSLSPSKPSLFSCHRQIRTSPSEPSRCRTAMNEGGTRLVIFNVDSVGFF
ncbi:hypothetical protein Hanom_Chr11g01010911 [Helianthus anomalus]